MPERTQIDVAGDNLQNLYRLLDEAPDKFSLTLIANLAIQKGIPGVREWLAHLDKDNAGTPVEGSGKYRGK